MIFYVVISSTMQEFCDFRPLVSAQNVEVKNLLILLLGPSVFLNVRVQVVVPALSTLLSDASLKVVCDLTPILSAISVDLLNQHAIFFLCPRAFDHFRIQHFLPSV